jgi:hypothetical protein
MRLRPDSTGKLGSVRWVTKAAVEEAKVLFPTTIGKWHIAGGALTDADGYIKDTSTGRHPGHYTFWKYVEINLERVFS